MVVPKTCSNSFLQLHHFNELSILHNQCFTHYILNSSISNHINEVLEYCLEVNDVVTMDVLWLHLIKRATTTRAALAVHSCVLEPSELLTDELSEHLVVLVAV